MIFGTLVNKLKGEGVFERKIKMLRTPLFALMSLLKSKEFLHKSMTVEQMKDLILKFLESDLDEVVKTENIRQSLSSWRQIISDLTISNEYFDTSVVNFPDLAFRKLQK